MGSKSFFQRYRLKIFCYLFLIVFLCVSGLPVYFVAMTAFKDKQEIYRPDITWWPEKFVADNFIEVWNKGTEVGQIGKRTFVAYFYNSLGISFFSSLVTLVGSALAAYVFSKYELGLKEAVTLLALLLFMVTAFGFWKMPWLARTIAIGLVFLMSLTLCILFARSRWIIGAAFLFIILASRTIPPLSLLVPFFMLATDMGMRDTWTVVVWTNVYTAMPFVIWLLKSFFDAIPRELAECARIDGCSNWGAFFRIMIPIAGPGIGAAGIITFLWSWNEFIFAQQLTSTPKARTIPVGLFDYVADYYTDYGAMTAAALITSVPPLIIILFFQKYIVSGLLAGAVKG